MQKLIGLLVYVRLQSCRAVVEGMDSRSDTHTCLGLLDLNFH